MLQRGRPRADGARPGVPLPCRICPREGPEMKRPLPRLDPAATALVLIDLQRMVVSRDTAPRPAMEVVRSCSRLVTAARRLGVLVVKVRVAFEPDRGDVLRQDVDESYSPPTTPGWD